MSKMRIRQVVESNTDTLVEQAGFQPEWLYVGTGGNVVLTPKSDPGNDVTVSVENGTWLPADDILYIKTTTTSSSFMVYG